MNPITLSRLGRSLHKATMDRMKQTINSNKPMINRAAVACAQPLTNKRKDKMLTQSLGHDWKCYLTHWSTPASCVYLRMPCMWTNSCNVIKFKRPEYIHIVSPTNGRISALSLSLTTFMNYSLSAILCAFDAIYYLVRSYNYHRVNFAYVPSIWRMEKQLICYPTSAYISSHAKDQLTGQSSPTPSFENTKYQSYGDVKSLKDKNHKNTLIIFHVKCRP